MRKLLRWLTCGGRERMLNKKRECHRIDCGNYLPIYDNNCRALSRIAGDTDSCDCYMTCEQAREVDHINMMAVSNSRYGGEKCRGPYKIDENIYTLYDSGNELLFTGSRYECASFLGMTPDTFMAAYKKQQSHPDSKHRCTIKSSEK